MAALCLFLSVTAQTTGTKTKVNPPIKPLHIGQRMPEVVLTNLHNYKTSSINLADFEAKLIIIDFWATWCSPCVAMIPKMDSLQKEFKHDVQFISVSYQSEKEVTSFMEKLEKQKNVHYSVPYSTDDNLLRFMFLHKTLPHYVWISANGTVRAITELKEVTSANIDKMLNSDSFTLPEKNDITIPYDYNKPFMVDGNGGNGSGLTYHSALSGYVLGLKSYIHLERADSINVNGLMISNCPLIWLYKLAFGNGYSRFYGNSRVHLAVRHPEEFTSRLSGNAYLAWLSEPGHGVCYELRVPRKSTKYLFPFFQQNLAMLFPQYSAKVEKRKVKCMALIRLPGDDNIKTKHPDSTIIESVDPFGFTMQNGDLESIMSQIQLKYFQYSAIPMVNKTGYRNRVDLKIKANLSSIPDMNRALEPYHLAWQERIEELEMLVISDADPISESTKKGL